MALMEEAVATFSMDVFDRNHAADIHGKYGSDGGGGVLIAGGQGGSITFDTCR